MKHLLILLFLAVNLTASAQYSDFFTTYTSPSVPSQSVPSQKYTIPFPNTVSDPILDAPAQMHVIDVDRWIQQYQQSQQQYQQSQQPQNIQMTTGIYLKDNTINGIKLKVGIIQNQLVVCGYWDGMSWHDTKDYSSNISYGAPQQIRQVCTQEVYIVGIGTVYF